MLEDVIVNEIKYTEIPWRFEGATSHIAGAIGLKKAINYLRHLGMHNVREHERTLTEYLLKRLREINHIEIYGPKDVNMRGGIVSFNLREVNYMAVTKALSKMGIMVRGGMHCAHPLHYRLGIKGSVRLVFMYTILKKKQMDYVQHQKL